jgi:anthranilate synthase component 1
VLGHAGDETHVALSAAVRVDLESPIAVFRKLAGERPGSFLLESVEGGELMGRYSFMGFGVTDRIEWDDGVATVSEDGVLATFGADDPLEILRERLAEYRVAAAAGLTRFQGGAVGWIGFDAMAAFEPVPLPDSDGAGLPAMRMLLPEDVVIYDHLAHRIVFVSHARLDGDRGQAWDAAAARLRTSIRAFAEATLPPEAPWAVTTGDPSAEERGATPNQTRAQFVASVREAKRAIEAGEIFQIVLSQRFTVAEGVDPFTLYRALRALNPSPYMFYLQFEDCTIVGSSPEVLVRLEDHEVLVRPIAGTRKRGADAREDEALEAELRADEKELAEHRMLLDLGRNDVGRVAAVGTVEVHDPLHIERYSHVMHIVSDVRGRIAPGLDAFDVFRACFPAGTVSGAPKIRACELLAKLEPDRRGVYAGAVGYFDYAGNMDTCIAIRTMVVTDEGVHVQAGAGVVFDSDPDAEYEECRNKARAAFAALSIARARGGSAARNCRPGAT